MRRRFLRLAGALLLGAAGAAGPAHAAGVAPAADDSLYRALGGQAGIAALMSDFAQRLKQDPVIGHFFDHTVARGLADSLAEQVGALSGGPVVYHGARMDKAHADLGIGRADFNRLVEVLQDTMDARGLPFHTQNELLALLAPMYRQIVTR